jgi:hypothetical protein
MDPQIVLHTAVPAGGFSCDAFVTHRAAHVLRIVIAPGNPTPTAATYTQQLGSDLQRELTNIYGPVPVAPCGGHQSHPPSCMFTIQANFLALVGDGSAALSPPSWAAAWKTLAILPDWAQPKATALLPLPLSTRLATFWNHSVQEAVPAVLAAAGVTPERPRIFISYKRDETQGFANQLFHGLAEAQFDVFLDHYRIPAGVELLARIRHELGDKTMVVALESAQLLHSRWTRYEIRVAQTLRLGLFGITVPGGVKVPGIGAARRQVVDHPDFVGGRFFPNSELEMPILKDIVSNIRSQHDRAIVQRRRQVIQSMQDALLLRKISAQYFDAAGRLCVRSGLFPRRDYKILLTSRSPELGDFHRASGPPSCSGQPVLVGVTRLMERKWREQIDWLSRTAGVPIRDEGRIDQTAADIAAGTL